MTARPPRRPPCRRQRGAALLIAMVLLTVVATLAAGMVWQQYRAVQVETAERARTQSAWILRGALDWARLILREHRSGYFSLLDAWAQPLEEARLSTFLAADRDNTTANEGPEAFLSGQIVDAQARYNVTNLLTPDGKVDELEKKVLDQLCQSAGLSASVAGQLVEQMAAAAGSDAAAPLMPSRFEDLAWLGLDAQGLAALRPWVTLLPVRTKVNVNTAPREVLAAVIGGIDAGAADRLVQTRQHQPFKTLDDVKKALPEGAWREKIGDRIDVKSDFFEIRGRLRLDDRVLEELSLVQRRGPGDVATVRSERVSSVLSQVAR